MSSDVGKCLIQGLIPSDSMFVLNIFLTKLNSMGGKKAPKYVSNSQALVNFYFPFPSPLLSSPSFPYLVVPGVELPFVLA